MKSNDNKQLLKDFFLLIKSKLKKIVISGIIGFAIGLIVAFSLGVEYKSSCELLAEESGNVGNNFGGLSEIAGLAGLDLNMIGEGGMSPELYPEIANSMEFIITLSDYTSKFGGSEGEISVFEYYRNRQDQSIIHSIGKFIIALPYKLKEAIYSEQREFPSEGSNENDFIALSLEEHEIYSDIRSRLNVKQDKSSGIISVGFETGDPYAAADITLKAKTLLEEYIVKYKTNKLEKDLSFLTVRYNESKQRFLETQKALARYLDKNKNLTSELARIELKGLEYEYELAFKIYNELSSKVESLQFQLQQRKPVFSMIKKPQIPVRKSKPARTIIIVSLTFLVSAFYLLFLMLKAGFINRILARE